MSLAQIHCRATSALKAPAVTIEVHLSQGLPAFHLVGLAETAVKEAKERVRSAIINSQFEFPSARITINLAPADLPKDSGRFDLGIAIGILAASNQIPNEKLNTFEFIGELGLNGELRSLSGILPCALACKNAGRQLICPEANQHEAGLAADNFLYANHLLEVSAFLKSQQGLTTCRAPKRIKPISLKDFSDVKGQYQAKRALEIAATGQHNVLMQGPPGCGKSMLAERFASILPPLSEAAILEQLSIRSLIQAISPDNIEVQHPYRSPHHSASAVAMVGGGNPPKAGEITLAHHGVLFLDELLEFPRNVLEALREPLESGKVCISRAAQQVEFPANFQLISAMNPCPCGYFGSQQQACRCTPQQIRRYQDKLSGPLLDRIDIHLNLQATPLNDLLAEHQQSKADTTSKPEESSQAIQQRVEAAYHHALKRQGCANAELQGSALHTHCQLQDEAQHALKQGAERLKLSARACQKILRCARTIADLAQSSDIQAAHIYEALSFRSQGPQQHLSQQAQVQPATSIQS